MYQQPCSYTFCGKTVFGKNVVKTCGSEADPIVKILDLTKEGCKEVNVEKSQKKRIMEVIRIHSYPIYSSLYSFTLQDSVDKAQICRCAESACNGVSNIQASKMSRIIIIIVFMMRMIFYFSKFTLTY